MAAMVTNENVLEALSKVLDPDIKKDLVTLNMIKDVAVSDDGSVSLTVELTTPACPLRETIKQDVVRAVSAIPGVKNVDVKMSARVRSDGVQRQQVQLPVQNVVAVASGKGGVGKSTLSVNLAVALAKSGARVGLMDADIYGPNIPTMMGVMNPPTQNGDKIVPAESHGVKIISIGFFVQPDQALIWRGPMLHNAIRQFVTDVEWGELDYMIIDLPPGTGDVQLSLVQTLPLTGSIIVTLPQKVSLDDARRGISMFRKLNIPVFGVVENMSYLELPDGTRMDIFGNGGGQELASQMDVPFIGEVPMDADVRVGGDNGNPIVIEKPESPSARALISVAEQLAARLSISAIKNAEIQDEDK